MIEKMHIENWRQFDTIDIEFDNRLTILTGTNGSGKTTILNVLSKLFGEQLLFVSNVTKDDKGNTKYNSGIKEVKSENVSDIQFTANSLLTIGSVNYDNHKSKISVPQNVNTQYDVVISELSKLSKGLYIDSHRSLFKYNSVINIPTHVMSRNEIYDRYHQYKNILSTNDYYNPKDIGPTKNIKEALISLATFGYGNDVVKKNSTAIKLYEGFQNILSKILPSEIGFEKIIIEMPEVLLKTTSGSFCIDAVSGGIASIIELAWQIYMLSPTDGKYTVLFDEPENHLHPELQQSLLPDLLASFPNAQFIVATHNPFIISSVKESKIYVLNYNKKKKIYSLLLDYNNRAATSNEILRDVLGIKNTLPIWAVNQINELVGKVEKKGITKESINELRENMSTLGMDSVIPDAILQVFNGGENND